MQVLRPWKTPIMGAFGQLVSDDVGVSEASWIAPRLGDWSTVGGLIPDGYECHFVVPHPDLPLAEARSQVDAALSRVLCDHAGTDRRVFVAVWEGDGWPGTLRTTSADPAARREVSLENERRVRTVKRALAAAPTFDLPERRYYLQVGECGVAYQLNEPGLEDRQPPDLWWPDDHSWFVATDIDLACSYIAGPAVLQGLLNEAFGTEIQRVQRSDHLEPS